MKELTRRDFLRLASTAAAGVGLIACQPKTVVVKETVEVEKVVKETVEVEKVVKETVEVEKQVTVAPGIAPSQAPMLKAMVETGEIPELDERIPTEPVVIEPLEEVGKYGGTWNRAGDTLSLNNRRGSEGLLHYGRDATTLELNLARDFEVADGGKTFTFFLRPGSKWSSGDPFTVDDIVYWYEDNLLNEEISPTITSWMRPGGEVGQMAKVDDYTVRFTFASPHGIFLDQQPFGALWMVSCPKEYLSQFHINYADKDKLDAMVKERGFEQWFQLHGAQRDWHRNPDFPVHGPWFISNGDWTTHQIAGRNAYYFKVDTEGNQLPYLDRVVNAVTDTEMVPMKIVGGEVDKQAWNTAIANYTLYQENKDQAGYEVYIWNYGTSGTSMHVNQAKQVEEGDAAGQELRELLQNLDFRIALSKAIDRDELNVLNYKGLAAPAIELFPADVQADSAVQAMLAYDPDEANEILDNLGMSERDSEGFRLTPKGETLNLNVVGHAAYAVHMDVAEVVTGYWRDVGVRATLDVLAGEMWSPRVRPGDFDVLAYEVDYTAGNVHWLTYPRAWLCHTWSCYWAPRYGAYYESGGSEGDEPPPEVARLHAIYDEALTTVDLEPRKLLEDEAFRICAENLYPVPTTASRPEPCIVKHGFRNVPEYAIMAYPVRGEKTTKPEQFFKDNP